MFLICLVKIFDLIFLADRWFNSTDIMKHIDSLGHTYCLRLKGSVSVYKDNIKTKAKKLKKRKYHAVVHKDVYITDKHYKTNIVISNSIDTSTPWIIATNKDVIHLFKIILIVLVPLNVSLKIKNLMALT